MRIDRDEYLEQLIQLTETETVHLYDLAFTGCKPRWRFFEENLV